MSKYSHLILIISVSILFPSLLSAQERVQETRLLAKTVSRGASLTESGALGSKLFAYSRSDESRDGSKLYLLKEGEEVLVFRTPHHEKIYDVQVSRDDSRIVFFTSGFSSSYPSIIFSVRPDGSQLTKIVTSGDDCRHFKSIPPRHPPFCSDPLAFQLSPDGQRVLFFNKVREWNEEAKENLYRFYLSMIPVTGGPIVRLEEVETGFQAVWSEDGASIYYHSGSPYTGRLNEQWNGSLRRYDLGTGRSEQIVEESWEVLTWGGLEVSPVDGSIYFVASKRGFARLDPEAGFAEVISEERFERFDLSPDGRRAVGVKEGDVTLVDLEFPNSAPLQVDSGPADELALGQVPAARERWLTQKMSRHQSTLSSLTSRAREAIGVKRVRWLDNEQLWCVMQQEDEAIEVGIVQLY